MTAPSRLVLVRHGETVGNSSIRYYGRTDIELSELGRDQMRAAARALRTELGFPQFAQIFASPLCRATEGARIIAGDAAPIVAIEEFREVDFGDFEGLTAGEIEDRFPREFALWNRDRLAPDYAYPGGESRANFAARVRNGIERMMALRRPGITLIVAHRGVIRTITQTLTDAEPTVELGSIQVLAANDARERPAACRSEVREARYYEWTVERRDFTAHLAEEPRPRSQS